MACILDRPELETWVALYEGTRRLFELELQVKTRLAVLLWVTASVPRSRIEGFTAKRNAVEARMGDWCKQVWVHTSHLYGPSALASFKAARLFGF